MYCTANDRYSLFPNCYHCRMSKRKLNTAGIWNSIYSSNTCYFRKYVTESSALNWKRDRLPSMCATSSIFTKVTWSLNTMHTVLVHVSAKLKWTPIQNEQPRPRVLDYCGRVWKWISIINVPMQEKLKIMNSETLHKSQHNECASFFEIWKWWIQSNTRMFPRLFANALSNLRTFLLAPSELTLGFCARKKKILRVCVYLAKFHINTAMYYLTAKCLPVQDKMFQLWLLGYLVFVWGPVSKFSRTKRAGSHTVPKAYEVDA